MKNLINATLNFLAKKLGPKPAKLDKALGQIQTFVDNLDAGIDEIVTARKANADRMAALQKADDALADKQLKGVDASMAIKGALGAITRG